MRAILVRVMMQVKATLHHNVSFWLSSVSQSEGCCIVIGMARSALKAMHQIEVSSSPKMEKASLAERLASAFFVQPGCSPVCVANSEPVTRAKAYEHLTYTASAIRQLNPALAQRFTDELLGFASMCLVKSLKHQGQS